MRTASGSGPLYYYFVNSNSLNRTEICPLFDQDGLVLLDRDNT
ncbi:MAG: hypothetical protein WCF90_01665 [Methanomicrobiales archaeon]